MINSIKRMAAFAALASIVSLGAFAQKASVTYVEGTANIKSSAGSLRAADFGSQVTYGESVITGKDGQAELKLENGSTIRIAENSVFSYSNVGTGKESRQVLATTAGKVAYKLNKAAGKSPLIQSNSMVAGVRGTEFTVLSGRDGSSLIEVTGGIVDVESQGTLVTLVKDEGVEVAPGRAPGAKYSRPGRELDFSDWNKGKIDAFLADPVAGLAAVETQLAGYQKSLVDMKKPYAEATATWKQAAADYKPILESKDEAAIKKFQDERLSPAQDNRAALILTIRYHALNYLSVRRFVMSNMYMEMKSRYPADRPANVETFFKNYAAMLAKYEDGIVPELNKNDY